MNSRPEVVFVFPDCMGGVASFNFNLINYSKLLKQVHTKVILLKNKEDKRPRFLDKFEADEIKYFDYSPKDNLYKTYRRLNKLIGNTDGALVADEAMTICAASAFSNPKTIFHLIHDYYYVNQNIGLGDLADVCIAHSTFFSDAVFASQPMLFADRTFYIPYGVKQLPAFPTKSKNEALKLVFLGRLDEGKGVLMLKSIDEMLIKQNVQVQWTIIGKGPLEEIVHTQWLNSGNVLFLKPDSTGEVYENLAGQDVFVLPTMFEGTPVAILESISNGIVPVVSDLPGGIRDIVSKDIGYRIPLNQLEGFTDSIRELHQDRDKLLEMQSAAFRLAKSKYDIEQNADIYIEKFLDFKGFRRTSKNKVFKYSRLDNRFLPNSFVKLLREIRK